MADATNSHDDDHGFDGGLCDLDGDDDMNGTNREGKRAKPAQHAEML
jgi:hypothetical protein